MTGGDGGYQAMGITQGKGNRASDTHGKIFHFGFLKGDNLYSPSASKVQLSAGAGLAMVL